MEEQNSSQLELFSQVNKEAGVNQRKSNPFIYLRGHEKAIILIIFFIITAIVSFSLGVERGKSLSLEKTDVRIELAQKVPEPKIPQPQITVVATPITAAVVNALPVKQQTPVQTLMQGYTIQVATFQTKSGAEKEALALKKRGMITSVITKGKYSILCVGRFPDKNAAKKTLTELKKQYSDCILRRI